MAQAMQQQHSQADELRNEATLLRQKLDKARDEEKLRLAALEKRNKSVTAFFSVTFWCMFVF